MSSQRSVRPTSMGSSASPVIKKNEHLTEDKRRNSVETSKVAPKLKIRDHSRSLPATSSSSPKNQNRDSISSQMEKSSYGSIESLLPELKTALTGHQKCALIGLAIAVMSESLGYRNQDSESPGYLSHIMWMEKIFFPFIDLLHLDNEEKEAYSTMARLMFDQATKHKVEFEPNHFLPNFGIEPIEQKQELNDVFENEKGDNDNEKDKHQIESKVEDAPSSEEKSDHITLPKELEHEISDGNGKGGCKISESGQEDVNEDNITTRTSEPGNNENAKDDKDFEYNQTENEKLGNNETVDMESQCEEEKPTQVIRQPEGPSFTYKLNLRSFYFDADVRWIVIGNLIHLALSNVSIYDARTRYFIMRLSELLQLNKYETFIIENKIAHNMSRHMSSGRLKHDEGAIECHDRMSKKKRWLLTGLATAGGATVIGLSAGLAAPLIGAGLGTLLGSIGVHGAVVTTLGSTALISSTAVVAGGGMGAMGMSRRTASVTDFKFLPVEINGDGNVVITISGWIYDELDYSLPFMNMEPEIHGERYALVWEEKALRALGKSLRGLAAEVAVTTTQQILQMTVLGAILAPLSAPMWLSKLGYLIDNPWANAVDRAHKTGLLLAESLMTQAQEGRPVTLIGYSLGGRVIGSCLNALAENKAYGLVENVYIIGAPIHFKKEIWQGCRDVVAGRFVNAYNPSDWVLSVTYRTSHVAYSEVAGLGPISDIPGIENVDISQIVSGHWAYREAMPKVLKYLGFRVTSEEFVEPETFLEPKEIESTLPTIITAKTPESETEEIPQEFMPKEISSSLPPMKVKLEDECDVEQDKEE